jgi:hypothetical protein
LRVALLLRVVEELAAERDGDPQHVAGAERSEIADREAACDAIEGERPSLLVDDRSDLEASVQTEEEGILPVREDLDPVRGRALHPAEARPKVDAEIGLGAARELSLVVLDDAPAGLRPMESHRPPARGDLIAAVIGVPQIAEDDRLGILSVSRETRDAMGDGEIVERDRSGRLMARPLDELRLRRIVRGEDAVDVAGSKRGFGAREDGRDRGMIGAGDVSSRAGRAGGESKEGAEGRGANLGKLHDRVSHPCSAARASRSFASKM